MWQKRPNPEPQGGRKNLVCDEKRRPEKRVDLFQASSTGSKVRRGTPGGKVVKKQINSQSVQGETFKKKVQMLDGV